MPRRCLCLCSTVRSWKSFILTDCAIIFKFIMLIWGEEWPGYHNFLAGHLGVEWWKFLQLQSRLGEQPSYDQHGPGIDGDGVCDIMIIWFCWIGGENDNSYIRRFHSKSFRTVLLWGTVGTTLASGSTSRAARPSATTSTSSVRGRRSAVTATTLAGLARNETMSSPKTTTTTTTGQWHSQRHHWQQHEHQRQWEQH